VSAPFPSSVFGMPVLSIGEAAALKDQGRLNGRDLAVAGWFLDVLLSCPYGGPYHGELEGWCRYVVFADTEQAATVCNDGPCSGGGDNEIDPWILTDTLGRVAPSGDQKPMPIVVIGHTDDPRSRQCLPGQEANCASDFVVDRVAWADGSEPASQPIAYNYGDEKIATPKSDLDAVQAALGNDQQILSAVAITADGVRSIDPRWNMTGDELLWAVRSVPAGGDDTDPTRPVTVSLVNDVTTEILDSHPLALAPDFDPARLWVTATRRHDNTGAEQDTYPYYSVVGTDGAFAQDGIVHNGSESIHGNTTTGPDLPLLLPPGTYSLSAWIGGRPPEGSSRGSAQCETTGDLSAGGDVMLQAVFDGQRACSWSNEAQPSFGSL
jgi:hypothetical protein